MGEAAGSSDGRGATVRRSGGFARVAGECRLHLFPLRGVGMSLASIALPALRSLMAMALAFAVVVLVTQGGGELGDFAGFPGGGEPRLAFDLCCVFVAGLAGAWVAVRLAPCAPRAHAAAFFAAMLAVAVLGVLQLGDDWPRWFSAGVVLGVPLQVGLGAWWALRRRGRARMR
jgi:hypothetical protein